MKTINVMKLIRGTTTDLVLFLLCNESYFQYFCKKEEKKKKSLFKLRLYKSLNYFHTSTPPKNVMFIFQKIKLNWG